MRVPRFQAEWKPVSSPESVLVKVGVRVGRKTGAHFC